MVFELTSEIKKAIDTSKVISFDVFDTLLFRIVNSPKVIFDLVGNRFRLDNYREIRMKQQSLASEYVKQQFGYAHANIDEIYEELKLCEQYNNVDWNAVKSYEIELERQSLVANDDVREIYDYAVLQGKRVIAVTDMYLSADFIKECLHQNGFTGIETVYCSADERKAKYDKGLFVEVKNRENVSFGDIFHIGDNMNSDVAIPTSLGIRIFHYKKEYDENRFDGVESSCIDEGIRKILSDNNKSFWYNFGIEAGGPVYMGLIQYLTTKIPNKDARIYFLSRDGYNLCRLFKKLGYKNAKYLYASRRALLLAGIEHMDDEDIALLPPFTIGQSVGNVLRYLCVEGNEVRFQDVGFDSIDSIIRTSEDINRFKKLYVLDRDVFINRARTERENAYKYFERMGVFDEDAYMFDCGWSGTSQYLLEKFKKAIGTHVKNKFFYFGLKDTVQRRRQLTELCYESFMDDYLANNYVTNHEAVYEILFSAPHNAVRFYDSLGPCLEYNAENVGKEDVFAGISDYCDRGYLFATISNIQYTCSESIGHIQEIITNPTDEEATNIGNLGSVDSLDDFGKITKRMAYITEKDYEEDKNAKIYWLEGFFKRKDISEALKKIVAEDRNIEYKQGKNAYYLESRYDLENYYYWMDTEKNDTANCDRLENYPMFSVVMPVYNTESGQLTEAILSVINQTYSHYELILVDDKSTWINVREVLSKYENYRNVKVIYRQENGHIAECTNTGLNEATGDYVVFMDCDDTIEPNALYEFAKAINDNPELDFIYSDADKITEDGLIRHNPFFKPDWSPELFASIMYTNHMGVYRTDIVKNLGGLRSITNGAQDYDFTLRFMEKSANSKVGHIAKILYHWRERKESIAYSFDSKNYAVDAEKRAKEDALIRKGLNGFLEYVPVISRYRTVLYPTGNPQVSIFVISTSDENALTRCISSIKENTRYKNHEIIEVRNDINEVISIATGDYFAFVSANVEIVQDDWLDRMLGHAELEHVGVVGAKLLYPNSTYIFHSGISKTDAGLSYDFKHYDDSEGHHVGFNLVDRNCLFVSDLCMVISKDRFMKLGGYNKDLSETLNSYDLCLRMVEHGYYNVIKNDVRVYCHAIGDELSEHDLDKGLNQNCLYDKHPWLKQDDPFLNTNLHVISDKLDLIMKAQKVDYVSISKTESTGEGEIAITDYYNQIRISGWSSITLPDDEDIVSRQLIISDECNNALVNAVSVPRLDIFEKNDRDIRHLKDGFITIIDGTDCKCRLDKSEFGILTNLSNGQKCYTKLSMIDGDEEALDIRKILSFCKGKSKIYVYGAGNYGNKCVNQLMALGISVEKVIVTNTNNNVMSVGGIEVIPVEEIKNVEHKDEIGVFVAVKASYRRQIIPGLNRSGIFNIMGYPLDIY